MIILVINVAISTTIDGQVSNLQLTNLENISFKLIGFGVKDIFTNLNVVTLRYFNRNNA